MGCAVGRQPTVLHGKCDTQLERNLSPKQVQLVKDTWAVVAANMADTGLVVFKRLLTRHPELCKLFPQFMTLKEEGYEWDLGGLQRHALLVMEALDAALENLDDSGTLAAILFDLGRKHGRLAVQEDMFDKLWEALRFGLQRALGDKMTREATNAWFQVYRYVSRQMIAGMRDYRAGARSSLGALRHTSTSD